MVYRYIEYGMMNMMSGSYGWMLFSWLIGLLVITGLVLFIILMTKKIQREENHKNERRLK
jgi:uncharacterized membrane protein